MFSQIVPNQLFNSPLDLTATGDFLYSMRLSSVRRLASKHLKANLGWSTIYISLKKLCKGSMVKTSAPCNTISNMGRIRG